jgi:hypothetical protein
VAVAVSSFVTLVDAAGRERRQLGHLLAHVLGVPHSHGSYYYEICINLLFGYNLNKEKGKNPQTSPRF